MRNLNLVIVSGMHAHMVRKRRTAINEELGGPMTLPKRAAFYPGIPLV